MCLAHLKCQWLEERGVREDDLEEAATSWNGLGLEGHSKAVGFYAGYGGKPWQGFEQGCNTWLRYGQ